MRHLDSGEASRALAPGYFLPDERTFSDFLGFVNQLSSRIRYFNSDDRPDGNWHELFISDEVFLLAEIDRFPLEQVEKKRISILISFENQPTVAGKLHIIRDLFESISRLLHTVNDWYLISARFNKNRDSTPLELELTSAIEYSGQASLLKLRAVSAGTLDREGAPFFQIDVSDFSSLWNKDQDVQGTDLQLSSGNPELLGKALKHLMLILKPVYSTVSVLMVRARQLLERSLEENPSHQPHIGLFLAFLQLYRYVQTDINSIPERQLKFYFEEILGLEKRPRVPDKMLLCFRVEDSHERLLIPQGSIVLAGQNAEGIERRYALERDVRLCSMQISRLYTFFISRNAQVDQNSRFQMVTGIYAGEVDINDEGAGAWSALGEEQRFLSPVDRTMSNATVGFAIASPVLRLSGGEREVTLIFTFTESSFHFLTTILMDISNFRRVKPDEIFHSVFSDSIELDYTGPEGWVGVKQFRFLPPTQWDIRQFSLQFTLDKGAPSLVHYAEEIHQADLGQQQPLLRIRLSGSNAYHPYSHLQFLELEELKVQVKVSDLRNLSLHSSTGPLSDSGPFELLGASPVKGSFLLIGNDEIFSKKLDDLQIGWDFYALPVGEAGLSAYFAGYPGEITNDSFRLRLSALSRYKFYPKEHEEAQLIDMFETSDESGGVSKSRFIGSVEVGKLNIRQRHDIRMEQLEDYNSRQELGFLKLELVSPAIGFGFEVYSDVYNAAISRSTDVKITRKSGNFTIEAPKDPFTPMAENLYINYTASTSLIFSTSRSFQNDANSQDSFIHLHPFGKQLIFSEAKIKGRKLIPFFNMEGSLFIGLEHVKPGDNINLLFDLERNDKWTFGKGPEIRWSYLCNDVWKPFRPEKILFDETSDLINPGILSIELPVDINSDNTTMASGLYWISAGASQKAELVSRIRRIYPNAASAIYLIDPKEQDHPISLPAHSVQSLEKDVAGVLSLHQPLPTMDGRPPETQMEFNLRVSEILRHKNRAITRWDMEKMLLRKFDWLSMVRTYGHMGNESILRVGQIVVVALPKIASSSVFYQPLLNPGQILKMEQYLAQVTSPFAEITIRNPTYEYIWFKGKIRLNSTEVGATLRSLYEDMLHYICPWFYGTTDTALSSQPFKRSDILNFIQNRPYVAFVTGFSIIHMKVDDDGKYLLRDSAGNDETDEIILGNPWSILVPFSGNNIEIIHDNTYYPPESTSLEDLMIGSNLIVGDEFKPGLTPESAQDLVPKGNEEKQDDFWFTLKI